MRERRSARPSGPGSRRGRTPRTPPVRPRGGPRRTRHRRNRPYPRQQSPAAPGPTRGDEPSPRSGERAAVRCAPPGPPAAPGTTATVRPETRPQPEQSQKRTHRPAATARTACGVRASRRPLPASSPLGYHPCAVSIATRRRGPARDRLRTRPARMRRGWPARIHRRSAPAPTGRRPCHTCAMRSPTTRHWHRWRRRPRYPLAEVGRPRP